MRAVELPRFGRPQEVMRLAYVDQQAPDDSSEEVVIDVLAAPINPMDLLIARGLYPMLPRLPAIMGAEGCGRVVGGHALDPGTMVLLPVRAGSWTQRMVVPASELIVLPGDVDPVQASMWRVNGLTALALLEGVEEGEWIVQAPGTGGVAQHIAQVARSRGIRTACLTRRADAHGDYLRELGADLVVADDARAIARVRQAAVGSRIRFGFDGVGGGTTARLAACLDTGGTLTSYGAMSQLPAQLTVDHVVFRDVRLRGFWLWRWAEDRDLRADVATLAAMKLRSHVASTWDLDSLHAALVAAQDPERFGRVLFRPND